jgi:Flp pilus assembly protein CpaB
MRRARGAGGGRRARAAAFLGLAVLAAAAAATIVAGYGSRVTRGYGALRPVVVLEAGLPRGRPIGPRELASALDVRRVPERFVPAGALPAPRDALGLVPRGPIPAGSYLLAGQLRPPRAPRSPGLGAGRSPVEISVSGADALLAGGRADGRRVDVVVTSEPSGPGPGRTYVAAEGVPLLAIGPGEDGTVPGGTASATLGLTRREALRLIAAESFARKLTLLPEG